MSYEECAEDGGDETGEVEGPFAADDVANETEADGANAADLVRRQRRKKRLWRVTEANLRETGIGAGEDETLPVPRNVHLLAADASADDLTESKQRGQHLLDGGGQETYTLRPCQVEEVAETAEKPDQFLVFAQAELLELASHRHPALVQ